MRRVAAVATAVTALIAFSGCAPTPITPQRVGAAVAPTFAKLYVLQQSVRGRTVRVDQLDAKAKCMRGGANTPDRGSGADWLCNITWFNPKPQIAVIATYKLVVAANGCYRAEGDGPPDVNGQQTIVAKDGSSVTNPLWEFDGCFDLG